MIELQSRRFAFAITLASLLPATFPGCSGVVEAQGVTTASISGFVTDSSGGGVAAADVEVVNRANGVSTRGRSRDGGRYTVAGLEVGGPYSLVVRRIGFLKQTRDGIFLSLGQDLRVDVTLGQQAVTLQAVTSRASADRSISRAQSGVGTFISDSAIRRLPTVNRDIYGLVRLVPQISTWYGLSAAGASPKMNGVMIDGASELGLYGGNPAGAIWGGKSISIEAVKEYQVLLSPFDVRQGNFVGAMINAVTKSGTNDLHGSAFYYGRNEQLARNVQFIRDARYNRAQFGFSVGGPLVRDRIHFFVAPEFQQMNTPATGPYVGQSVASATPLPVDAAAVARFQQLIEARGLQAGTAGIVTNGNPLANVFGRLDVALPAWNSRLVLRQNYNHTDSLAFSRPSPPPTPNCPTSACFPLSSVGRRQVAEKNAIVAHVYTSFPSGAYNELTAARLTAPSTIQPDVRQPLVVVAVPSTNGQTASLQAGSYEQAQGDRTDQQSFEISDNLVLPIGAHGLTIGTTAQFYRARRLDLRGAYGVWEFSSLDSLAAGSAQRYHVAKDFGGANVTVRGAQYGVYAGDQWEVGSRLALTYGLRGDVPVLNERPPYVAVVDSLFGRRTDHVPSGRMQWSPRAGFALDVTGDRRTKLRGGVGFFLGRPPVSWLADAFAYYGLGARVLTCTQPPPFATDYRNPPLVCGNGQGFNSATVGEVDLLDEHLKFPQMLRTSLGLDRQLAWDMVATLEALYTRGRHQLFFVNGNLADPAGVDRHGRVLYGTIDALGVATAKRASPQYAADVIDIGNQSKDYSYSLTGQLDKRFTNRVEGKVAFNYSRVRDVESERLTRSAASDNWRFGRVLSGRQSETNVGISDFDQPYRVVVSGTYTFPWRTWSTDASLYYVGSSGFPYTYTAGGDTRRGDLNADGTSANDPIYIPRNAADTAEIRFGGTASQIAAQQAAFEQFIDEAGCLRRQRGSIMTRNSCRSPWVDVTNVALRQSLPAPRGHSITLEVEVFNFLNLLDSQWGAIRMPNPVGAAMFSQVSLLSQVGQTAGPLSQSQPILTFDPTLRRFDSQNIDSYYQIQFAARYSF